MVRFGAKKVETSPPFLFDGGQTSKLYSFSEPFIVLRFPSGISTKLNGFYLKAFFSKDPYPTFEEP